MYSWAEDTSKWYGDGTYRYGAKGAARRKAAAKRAKAHGPRTYEGTSGPNEAIIDPQKAHSQYIHQPAHRGRRRDRLDGQLAV